MSEEVYRELRSHPSTRLAVPLALGDSFRGYPVIATTTAFFAPGFGMAAEPPMASGRFFDESAAEAMVGAGVARELGIHLGDRIEPAHGSEAESVAHDGDHLFRVVGILASTD